MSTLKVSTISPLGTDATKTITIGSASNGDVAAGVFTNVPAFWVALSSNQSISNDTSTKIQFDTVTLDTNSDWDSTNYRFTPSIAGYYFIYGKWRISTSTDAQQIKCELKKNGTEFSTGSSQNDASNTAQASGMVHLNGSSDYIEMFVYHTVGSSQNAAGQTQYTLFQGYKLIGA